MARNRARQFDREALARAGALVAGCTLVLTASFVGLVALVSGAAVGVVDRLPLYVLGMASAFVGAIVVFEMEGEDGGRVLLIAGALALTTFLVTLLSGEGIVHALRHPGQVIASQLLLYLLAAGMIATGLGYWVGQHWQELPQFISGVSVKSSSPKAGSGRGL